MSVWPQWDGEPGPTLLHQWGPGTDDEYRPGTSQLVDGKWVHENDVKGGLKAMSKEYCSQCPKEILIQIFKGTGVCSEKCRKIRDNDHKVAGT